ncbi:putative effector protein [Erysiphe neolycopersici]|uniref:Putative effector protein n=1 Tax=Erysiphe neolycopersici TaxID=212602 RepID=A0A420I5Q5_9PEZI|nr:putative effector protein [Erysiphe neolycopersici]
MARIHTKHQTYHAIGGNPMQAFMASTISSYKTSAIPVERLHQIISTSSSFAGRLPDYLDLEEYFAIQAHTPPVSTPPVSTHHYFVATAGIKALRPFGILRILPESARIQDVEVGVVLVKEYGATEVQR